jgi:hypothetical protein
MPFWAGGDAGVGELGEVISASCAAVDREAIDRADREERTCARPTCSNVRVAIAHVRSYK